MLACIKVGFYTYKNIPSFAAMGFVDAENSRQ